MTGKWENLRLERNYLLVAKVIILKMKCYHFQIKCLLFPNLVVLERNAETCLSTLWQLFSNFAKLNPEKKYGN